MKFEAPAFSEKRTVHTTDKFGSIRHLPSACDGDIYTAFNIDYHKYPAISHCKDRYTVSILDNADEYSSLGFDNKLYYSAGGKFIYDGKVKGDLTPGRKFYANIGNTIVIFPDKKYYRHGTLAYRTTYGALTLCTDENQYDTSVKLIAIAEEKPASANEGDIFYQSSLNYIYTYSSGKWVNSGRPDELTKYLIDIDEFGSLDDKYIWDPSSVSRFELTTVGDDGSEGNTNLKFTFLTDNSLLKRNFRSLKVGDYISVTGVMLQSLSQTNIVEKLSEGTVITDIGTSHITVKNTVGVTNLTSSQNSNSDKVKFQRIIPTLSCITRVGDRLWGAYKNKIYACEPNDPFKWCYEKDMGDTLVLRPDVSDDIIGCASLGDIPVFFTENSIIKILRVYNGYKASVTPLTSVSANNIRSIAFASGDIYYASSIGVIRYNGTSAEKIKCDLGISFNNLAGGSDGTNYYLFDSSNLYIYHPDTDTWGTESGNFTSLTRSGSDIYGICKLNSDYALVLLGKNKEDVPNELINSGYSPGSAQIYFSPFYEGTHEKKTFTKLILTADTSSETSISLYTSFDGKPYEYLTSIRNKSGVNRTEIPLTPNRADYMRIYMIASNGKFELISLSREFITHSNYN